MFPAIHISLWHVGCLNNFRLDLFYRFYIYWIQTDSLQHRQFNIHYIYCLHNLSICLKKKECISPTKKCKFKKYTLDRSKWVREWSHSENWTRAENFRMVDIEINAWSSLFPIIENNLILYLYPKKCIKFIQSESSIWSR